MKLFQYEQFFSKHSDPEVRKRGAFLIQLIDQLEAALLISSDWAKWPRVSGLNRIEQMKIQIVLCALDRHDGRKRAACKWLGISDRMLRYELAKWNKMKYNKRDTHENTHNRIINVHSNGVPDSKNG